MEYHRRGPHQGFWRLKPTVQIPSDQDMLKMLSPESVVLAESMQVGQRHLQDSGYGRAAEQDEGDESNLSIEQQLAPWITSKNFLQAAQNKAMLKLHGEGDPSGRGEAFSFIRVSMKEIFVRAGEDYEQKMAEADNRPKHAHRYNVQEQQVIYRSEVERIWKAQFESLARRDEPEFSAEDERRAAQQAKKEKMEMMGDKHVAPSPGMSRASSVDRDMSLNGMEGSASRVIRIRRLVGNRSFSIIHH
jgi:transcription initiation factor TFIID subunit 1, fungi type